MNKVINYGKSINKADPKGKEKVLEIKPSMLSEQIKN